MALLVGLREELGEPEPVGVLCHDDTNAQALPDANPKIALRRTGLREGASEGSARREPRIALEPNTAARTRMRYARGLERLPT